MNGLWRNQQRQPPLWGNMRFLSQELVEPKFKAASGEAALFELRMRMLAGKIPKGRDLPIDTVLSKVYETPHAYLVQFFPIQLFQISPIIPFVFLRKVAYLPLDIEYNPLF